MSSINLNDAACYSKQGQLLGSTITMLAWDLFGKWLKKWREDHPDDDRNDYDLLIEEYNCESTRSPLSVLRQSRAGLL